MLETLATCGFSTERLKLQGVAAVLVEDLSEEAFLQRIIGLLSDEVVQPLPGYFHNINTMDKARQWLKKMRFESHLLIIQSRDSATIMGCVFLHEGDNKTVHLGYFLGQSYWRKGYAREVLNGLIAWCKTSTAVNQLVGGVEADNVASSKLLRQIGFEKIETNAHGVSFYGLNCA